MNVRREHPASHASSRGSVLIALVVIAIATLAAYHNSFSGPFVFDDVPAIVENQTIRRLNLSVLRPFGNSGGTVTGRPMVNASLAVNYAAGGTDVAGYHAVNLACHTLAALVLFGFVRRTLLLPSAARRFGAASTLLAGAIAVVWATHPLATSAVTYVIQRAEVMMALFYLSTLYCFARGAA
ncbi:MAG: hypothetical protein HY736_23585, partial [Verrucomicrobia bacterium]|nr:hypothetical protein [Verrucomicrobiota bacterium]